MRSSLASAIEQVAPDAATVAVLNYYQPIPQPGQIANGTSLSGSETNLVCTGLKANAASTSAAADFVLSTLNDSVAAAVADARAHGVRNVVLIDVAHAFDGHGICTADPWAFSSERVPDATLGRRRRAHPGGQGVHGGALSAARHSVLLRWWPAPTRRSSHSRTTSGAPRTRRRTANARSAAAVDTALRGRA